MSTHKRVNLFRRLKGFLQKHMHGMITCLQFNDFIGRYIDGELSQQQLTVFETHLRFCRECREYLEAYERAIEVGHAVMSSSNNTLPEDVPEDLVKAILDARKAED